MITRENLLIGDCDYDGVQFHFLPIDVDESTLYETGDYVLRLHGILTNGCRMRIDVCGIKPFFDILIDGLNVDEILSEIECESHEIIQAKLINLFCENIKEFVRFYFKNSGIRSKQLKMVKDRYVTYSNDLTFHYRKVLREGKIDVTRWKMIESSELVYGNDQYRKVLKVHRDHIINGQNPLKRNRIMILCWDIETYSSREGGEVPKPEYDKDEDLNECEDWIFKRSYSQEQMIMDFAYCKAERLNILRDFVSMMSGMKFKGSSISDAGYNIYENNIKITAQDNVRVMYFHKLGTLMIDVMVSFRKMYPNSERNSLSHFLKMINLKGKMDLSHLVLRKYYRDCKDGNVSAEESKENMSEIAQYCMMDARHCQELMLKINVIDSYRKMSGISYVSIFDSYCYAGGIKVCNLLGTMACDMNILINIIRNDNVKEGKYPGAYVYEPIKGLNNRRPVTGLDFSLLYPSLMMTYNLSPEMMIVNQLERDR
ncbi:15646_t:CDS:2, partial [Acaulospora morrowiae]